MSCHQPLCGTVSDVGGSRAAVAVRDGEAVVMPGLNATSDLLPSGQHIIVRKGSGIVRHSTRAAARAGGDERFSL